MGLSYGRYGQNGPVIEEIALGTPDFNKAKFAFKYVNEAASDAFKVQTAWYDYDSAVKAGLDNKEDWTWNNEGYLKEVCKRCDRRNERLYARRRVLDGSR